MQQFNLDKALKGAKLVTRDGREVMKFRKHDNENISKDYPYQATFLDGARLFFMPDGVYLNNCITNGDLFLADEPNPTTPHPFILKVSEMASNDAELQTLLSTFLNDYPQFK